jgi:apolipoprotein N-acyltransferase
MSEVLAAEPPIQRRRPLFLTAIRESAPSFRESGLASSSAVLLVLSFPNFELWWLAWIGLAPLLFAVATTSRKRTAFVLGLIWGVIFFYGTCWWLTYPMVHFAGIPPWLAYPLLLIPVSFVSLFPALTCASASLVVRRFGGTAILAAPIFWIAFDWLRGAVTGLDWNAIGYSQAFHRTSLQAAQIGGVHAVTFLLVLVNATLGYLLVRRNRRSLVASAVILSAIVFIIFTTRLRSSDFDTARLVSLQPVETAAVGIQPNVPMIQMGDAEYRQLLARHLELSAQGLLDGRVRDAKHRLVVWPESPMNFAYSRDPQLQNVIANLARTHRTSVLLNSLEPTANGGSYNSAILINEQGQKIAQYDKIRLMPFGEYVPLPRWLPGSGSVRSIVGEFTPGSSHTLMPLGALRAGVFICIEAAHADVARSFTSAGADVLINISNDGYLGPTAVMRQHLANAVFRAVENDRDLVRVTNSGISAYIDANGHVHDATPSFQEAVRTWTVSKTAAGPTFYSRHGDVFAYGCALISLGFISATFMTRRKGTHASHVLGN